MKAVTIEWKHGTQPCGNDYEQVPCMNAYTNGKYIGYYLLPGSPYSHHPDFASFRQFGIDLSHGNSTWKRADIERLIQEDVNALWAQLSDPTPNSPETSNS